MLLNIPSTLGALLRICPYRLLALLLLCLAPLVRLAFSIALSLLYALSLFSLELFLKCLGGGCILGYLLASGSFIRLS
jgi:hypothetical protein